MLPAMKCSSSSSSQNGLFPALTFAQCKKAISEEWFQSPSTLALRALGTHLVMSGSLSDTVSLRGVLMSDALGLCPIPKLCPENKRHQVILAEEWSSKDGLRFRLKCSHSCFRQRLCPAGLLSKVHVSLWLAIIYFVKAMRLNYRWTKLMTDMESVFGVKNKRTFQTWRGLYQDALKLYLQKHGSITLGKSPGDVVVFDETHIGIASEGFPNLLRVKGQPSSRSAAAMKQKIAKRLPARTVHKRPSMKRPASSSCRRPAAIPLRRPASVMKSIYNKGKKRTDKDARSGGRWLFAAVLVCNKKKGTLMRMAKRDSPFLCCQSLL